MNRTQPQIDYSSITMAFLILFLSLAVGPSNGEASDTVALWLFDEQIGIYPSCVLSDASPNDYPVVIGVGGQIAEGKFGNALEPIQRPPIEYPSGNDRFGLRSVKKPEGRSVEPMTWKTANFCALMTSGENHLRKTVGFANPTQTKLNLGAFDWTVEFWFMPARKAPAEGVVFEVGQGPRGENDSVTRLCLNPDQRSFTLYNQPSGTRLTIPSDADVLSPQSGGWHHLAFVYSPVERQLRHCVDGVVQTLPEKCDLRALDYGDEAYFSLGRDGLWERPLLGRIDELRFSATQVYTGSFTPPTSFSKTHGAKRPKLTLKVGPRVLFGEGADTAIPVPLDSRKYLFIDDAIVEEMENITFAVNPPRLAERVIEGIKGHLVLIEDEEGLIRLYYEGPGDSLAVMTSRNGVTWEKPNLGRGEYRGRRNIVIRDAVGLGTIFMDPNAPLEERWKYVSGVRGRGVYVYSSPDGWSFERQETAALPLTAGSQSVVYYDEQRQLYVGYHRSDLGATPDGHTQRVFVLTEVKGILKPWPFEPVSRAQEMEVAKTKRLHDLHPWYVDNGPLTPGGFGIEYPVVFAPDDSLDALATDIYVPKAIKYPWAPDTYLAFPVVYFHYDEGPEQRQILGREARGRGSGPTETQVAVSRDGLDWKRYPRPTYIGNGRHAGHDIHMAYSAHGMVKRGEEIWQYYLGSDEYHSAYKGAPRGVYRLVQRLDGFVSADSSYTGGVLKTKPLRFTGNRLILNIDTDATGYAQVSFLDAQGKPIPGYGVEDCIYINGDFIDAEVEWLSRGPDVSPLEGQTVQLVFRMRGCKLYAMQFTKK